MPNKTWIQKGYNCEWPYKIETWSIGDPVPEWLSDVARIDFIDGEGNMTLKTRKTSKDGIEIIQASGSGSLVRLEHKDDLVYISLPTPKSITFPEEFEPTTKNNYPKVITKSQLNFLYRPITI